MAKKEEDKLLAAFQKLKQKTSQSSFEAWQSFVYLIGYQIAYASGNDCEFMRNYFESACTVMSKAKEEFEAIENEFISSIEKMAFNDVLGEMYMRLGVGNEANGQFFTPFSLSKISAKISFNEQVINQAINENSFVRVSEPAAGAGANLIAFCGLCYEKGIDYQCRVFFECRELSELTSLMCYIQLSLIGAAAIVIIGDTLKLEERVVLKTPIMNIEPCWILRTLRGEI